MEAVWTTQSLQTQGLAGGRTKPILGCADTNRPSRKASRTFSSRECAEGGSLQINVDLWFEWLIICHCASNDSQVMTPVSPMWSSSKMRETGGDLGSSLSHWLVVVITQTKSASATGPHGTHWAALLKPDVLSSWHGH